MDSQRYYSMKDAYTKMYMTEEEGKKPEGFMLHDDLSEVFDWIASSEIQINRDSDELTDSSDFDSEYDSDDSTDSEESSSSY